MNRPALVGFLAALLALSVGVGVQSVRLSAEQRDHEATKAAHAEKMQTLERAARESEQAARAEEHRRMAALEGVIRETEQNLERARADAAAAADAGQRLRDRAAAIAAACRGPARHTAAAPPGPSASSPGDMLAFVQRRLDEAAGEIAGFADRAREAGRACEVSYDAVRPP